jgi:hypothetical protein
VSNEDNPTPVPPPGLSASCHICWQAILRNHESILRLEAQRGRVETSPALLALLWTILAGVITMVFFIARLDAQVTNTALAVATVRTDFNQHIQAPGHRESVMRIDELQREVDQIKSGARQR